MIEQRKRANQMNYLALVQNVLGILPVIGGRTEAAPIVEVDLGYVTVEIGHLYTHDLTQREIREGDATALGSLTDPNLMPGMPTVGGELWFYFVDIPEAYVLVIQGKLAEWAHGESDMIELAVGRIWKRDLKDDLPMADLTFEDGFAFGGPSIAILHGLFKHYISSKALAEELEDVHGDIVRFALERLMEDFDTE